MAKRLGKVVNLRGYAVMAGALALGSLGCANKGDTRGTVTLRGRLTVPSEVQTGTLLIAISGQSFDQLASDPLGKMLKFVATRDFSGYEIQLTESELAKIDNLQVYGLLHRDPALKQVPSLTKNDFFGFFTNGTHTGLVLSDRSSKTFYADLSVNRVYQGKSVQIPYQIEDGATGAVVTGLYCGEIQSASPKQFDLNNIITVKTMQKTQPVQGEKLDFPLLQVTPSDYCYLFAFNDANNSQTLDQVATCSFEDGKNQKKIILGIGELAKEDAEQYRLLLRAINGQIPPDQVTDIEQIVFGDERQYLDVLAINALWRELGLSKIFDSTCDNGQRLSNEHVARILTINRLLHPSSKVRSVEWFSTTLLATIMEIDQEAYDRNKIFRELSSIHAAKDKLERLFWSYCCVAVPMTSPVSIPVA